MRSISSGRKFSVVITRVIPQNVANIRKSSPDNPKIEVKTSDTSSLVTSLWNQKNLLVIVKTIIDNQESLTIRRSNTPRQQHVIVKHLLSNQLYRTSKESPMDAVFRPQYLWDCKTVLITILMIISVSSLHKVINVWSGFNEQFVNQTGSFNCNIECKYWHTNTHLH